MMLLYIANVRFPTEKAYGVQIAEMCEAFAKARGRTRKDTPTNADIEVTLIVPTRKNHDFQGIDPFEYYGVERNFDLQYLKTPDPTPLMKFSGGLYIKIQSLLFMRELRKYLNEKITNYKLQITNNDQNSKSRLPNKFKIQNSDNQDSQITKTSSSTLIEDPETKSKQKKNPFGFLFSFLDSRLWGNDEGGRGNDEDWKIASPPVGGFAMTGDEETIIYTRDEYLLPFLQWYSKNVVWEAHTLPKRRFYYVRYWKRCRAIVAITKGLKDELVRMGVEPDKILVAPDGVDLDKFKVSARGGFASGEQSLKFKIREELNLPNDKKIVMYTGQLFEWKGAGVLLEVARNFQFSIFNFQRSEEYFPQADDIAFVFVGGMQEDVERFKKKAEGLRNVLILGHQSPRKIPLFQMSADVLVMPNTKGSDISEHWTSPLKLFEYMASGVPIVASDLPSIREILNESNALLVEPNKSDALLEGIQKVLRNIEFSRTIAEKAKRDALEYSWERRAERILEFIQK